MIANEREPPEPVVAIDPLTDPSVLECPAQAAIGTIAQAFETHPIVTFFSNEGKEYARALLQLLRTRHLYQIHELSQCTCVAFVLDTADPDQPSPTAEPELDEQAVATALAEGSVDKLVALGMPRTRAELEVLARLERRAWLWELMAEAGARLDAFVQEHGPVLHLAYLGCREPGQGWGSKMLRHLAKVADAQHKWIYVDNVTERTAGLFHCYGFHDFGVHQVGGEEGRASGAPALRIMARPPGVQRVEEKAELS